MAGEAQPSFLDSSKQNYDPSAQDWADAYKPVDKALNKMFETRITNDNARQEQYELAVVSDMSLSTEQGSAGSSLSFTDTSSEQGAQYVRMLIISDNAQSVMSWPW